MFMLNASMYMEAFCIKGCGQLETYESIKLWKNQYMHTVMHDVKALNDFHDQVMLKVFHVAKNVLAKDPPCLFSWFITGSGGRLEQGLYSDQDHGIVYEFSNIETDSYFRMLGDELSYGLDVVGYPYCQGHIMSSNPQWCKPLDQWGEQLLVWMDDESFEMIRYLQIFYDARVLVGQRDYILQLKQVIYRYQRQHSLLLQRFAANVSHVKNVIGPLGQILVERHGIHQGCVNIKYAGFMPYVNSIRLLSMKEGITETSTLRRIRELSHYSQYEEMLRNGELNFQQLLQLQSSLYQVDSYEDMHYVYVEKLTKIQKKEIKRILKDGKKLHDAVISYVKKGVYDGI